MFKFAFKATSPFSSSSSSSSPSSTSVFTYIRALHACLLISPHLLSFFRRSSFSIRPVYSDQSYSGHLKLLAKRQLTFGSFTIVRSKQIDFLLQQFRFTVDWIHVAGSTRQNVFFRLEHDETMFDFVHADRSCVSHHFFATTFLAPLSLFPLSVLPFRPYLFFSFLVSFFLRLPSESNMFSGCRSFVNPKVQKRSRPTQSHQTVLIYFRFQTILHDRALCVEMSCETSFHVWS